MRHAPGSVLSPEAGVEAEPGVDGDRDDPDLTLTLRNHSATTQTLQVSGLHNSVQTFEVESKETKEQPLDPLANHHGWYDLVVNLAGHPLFTRRSAGHLENGLPARTGPD